GETRCRRAALLHDPVAAAPRKHRRSAATPVLAVHDRGLGAAAGLARAGPVARRRDRLVRAAFLVPARRDLRDPGTALCLAVPCRDRADHRLCPADRGADTEARVRPDGVRLADDPDALNGRAPWRSAGTPAAGVTPNPCAEAVALAAPAAGAGPRDHHPPASPVLSRERRRERVAASDLGQSTVLCHVRLRSVRAAG